MTTFDSDFAQLQMTLGKRNVPLKALNLEWPPPERIYLPEKGDIRAAEEGDPEHFIMQRVSMSEISDEVIKLGSRIARGAVYMYLDQAEPILAMRERAAKAKREQESNEAAEEAIQREVEKHGGG